MRDNASVPSTVQPGHPTIRPSQRRLVECEGEASDTCTYISACILREIFDRVVEGPVLLSGRFHSQLLICKPKARKTVYTLFLFCRRRDQFLDAWDRDHTFRVYELPKQLDQVGQGLVNHASVCARMEIVFCAGNFDTEDGDTSEAIRERGVTGVEPVVVRLFAIRKSAVMTGTIT